jgi:UDP-N-acetyl-D-mannosaminuronate dehydrogenase
LREKVIIGYKGEIGSALMKILKAEWGIDKDIIYCSKYSDYPPCISCELTTVPKGLIMHVCLPYKNEFCDTVVEYADKLSPKMVIVHSTVPMGTCQFISDELEIEIPVIHAPINGKHPSIEKDIRKYTMFIGSARYIDEWGEMACEYLEYYGINTYLCSDSTTTELAKLFSTEFLRTQIKFFQYMKSFCVEYNAKWAEVIEFFKAINYKTFQRAGFIDTPMSGKHCLNNNHKILKEDCGIG